MKSILEFLQKKKPAAKHIEPIIWKEGSANILPDDVFGIEWGSTGDMHRVIAISKGAPYMSWNNLVCPVYFMYDAGDAIKVNASLKTPRKCLQELVNLLKKYNLQCDKSRSVVDDITEVSLTDKRNYIFTDIEEQFMSEAYYVIQKYI